MSSELRWNSDGRSWPNRAASTFVRLGPMTWHIQVSGSGPALVLAHGMGASTHSWRDLMPALADHFTVIAPDLPGHAFTSRAEGTGMSLGGMSSALGDLLDRLEVRPALAVGHSAGAAILCRMALDGRIAPNGIVSLNGALLGFRGATGHIFSPLAKLLASNAILARVLAATLSGRASVERLIAEQGSTLDRRGIDLYHRLVQSSAHVGGALAMMANWDLAAFERDLPRLGTPLLQIVGGNDRSVPPSAAFKVRGMLPGAKVDEIRGLGHLAHEERPLEIAARIVAFAESVGAATERLDAPDAGRRAAAPGQPSAQADVPHGVLGTPDG